MGSVASLMLDNCGRALHGGLDAEKANYLARQKCKCVATACGECPRGCGLLVNIENGHIQRMEGNPVHPVNHGNICQRSLAACGLRYSSDRVRGPLWQPERGAGIFSPLNWRTAGGVLRDALRKYAPGEIAFLLGLFPDHLNDLVQLLSKAMGGFRVLRLSSIDEMDGRVTLMDATQKLFGVGRIPHFDLEHADLIYSFGASFSESWFPLGLETKDPMRHCRLVQFGARRMDAFRNPSKWIPIPPGSEAILAQALARLVTEYTSGAVLPAFSLVDLDRAVEMSGIPLVEMKRLALRFVQSPSKLAIPGSISLGSTNGLAAAQAILALNVAANNLGIEGGLFLPPDSPIFPGLSSRPNTIAEVSALIEDMKNGRVKALLVHGLDPVHDLPESFGFEEALKNVELVISFASFNDETTPQADYLFPDHTHLEGWGYQRVFTGGEGMAISGMQPVVSPLFNTRSTVDLILEAVHAIGKDNAASIPYTDEVDFLQKSLAPLMKRRNIYNAPSPDLFWRQWLKNGGWWETTPNWIPPVVCASLDQPWNLLEPDPLKEEGQNYFLLPLLNPDSAIKERTHRLNPQDNQEMTTNGQSHLRAEMHTETGQSLGLRDDDVVKISSTDGEIRAVVQIVPTIRPDTIAISKAEEWIVSPSSSEDRKQNPLDLLGKEQNESGELASAAKRVKIIAV
jgi:anaerobic selenocysteine-containing dehydrogenase